MAAIKFTQQEKAKQLYELHYSNKLLVLPNIWDVLGALLLEDIGYPAIATASAAVAYTKGYNDGENIPFDDVLHNLKRIANSVNVPVTADIESGYAQNEIQFEKNIRSLIKTGIAGINIEDTDKKTKSLLPAEVQCERIKRIKKVSEEMNVPLFINARTDTFIHAKNFSSPQQQLEETIQRGSAYKDAGADCFYPILFSKQEDIKAIVEAVKIPVNILMAPGIPDLNELQAIGVARVSLGPGFLRYAIKAMKELAIKLQYNEGLNEVIANEITSDYFKKLIMR